jgi:RNA polymerase sigma factor (sigma-70 family)
VRTARPAGQLDQPPAFGAVPVGGRVVVRRGAGGAEQVGGGGEPHSVKRWSTGRRSAAGWLVPDGGAGDPSRRPQGEATVITTTYDRPTGSARDLLEIVETEHRHALLAYATRLTGSRATAEDIVQETMVRAWPHLDRLAVGTGPIRGWLMTVTRNLATDRSRAVAARPAEVHELPARPPTTADHADDVIASADDRQRQRVLLDQVDPPAGGEPVEQVVGDRLHPRPEPVHGPGGERLRDQPAQPGVVRRVGGEHVLGRMDAYEPELRCGTTARARSTSLLSRGSFSSDRASEYRSTSQAGTPPQTTIGRTAPRRAGRRTARAGPG